MLLHEGRLYLAGGNVVSPAAYDLRSGECLNTLLADEWVKAPRGRELFVLGGKVTAFERLLYTPKEYWPGRYFGRNLLQVQRGEAIVRSVDGRVLRMAADEPDSRNPKGRWESGLFQEVLAMALGNNAVVVAGRLKATPQHEGGPAVAALGLADGTPLWSLPLAAAPTYQCLALTGRGSILLSTDRPQCLCLAGE
jgi:hypothetical protein